MLICPHRGTRQAPLSAVKYIKYRLAFASQCARCRVPTHSSARCADHPNLAAAIFPHDAAAQTGT